MKKLLTAMLVMCLGLTIMAGSTKKTEDYNSMDVGFWFGLPTAMETANVRGMRLGLPISSGSGYVRGLELALFCAATDDINGLQLSTVALAKKLAGAQISLVNVCCGEVQGTQIGIVNCAGERGWQFGLVNSSENAKFQLGLINMNPEGLWPFSFLVNFGRDTFKSSETIRAERPCPKCKSYTCSCKK